MAKKRKRKLRIDRLLILFVAFVLVTVLVFTIIKELFFPSVFYNYKLQPTQDLNHLPLHNYNFDNLSKDLYYRYDDDNYYSKFGIDVSSHQGTIDWQQVKDFGVDFAYLRLGYRGYTEGKIIKDSTFEENYKNAKEHGIEVGVYFFSQAINEKEAMDEAYFVLENILKKDIDLPIVYDLEHIDYDNGRIANLSKEEWTNNAIAFLQKVDENGYDGMLYTNLYWANEYYNLAQVLRYPIWLAQYDGLPKFPYQFSIWQYSDSGTIPGIEEPVDLNIMWCPKES